VIEHRWPDIVVVEKDNKTALLINRAVPGETSRGEGAGESGYRPIPESGMGLEALESEY